MSLPEFINGPAAPPSLSLSSISLWIIPKSPEGQKLDLTHLKTPCSAQVTEKSIKVYKENIRIVSI